VQRGKLKRGAAPVAEPMFVEPPIIRSFDNQMVGRYRPTSPTALSAGAAQPQVSERHPMIKVHIC